MEVRTTDNDIAAVDPAAMSYEVIDFGSKPKDCLLVGHATPAIEQALARSLALPCCLDLLRGHCAVVVGVKPVEVRQRAGLIFLQTDLAVLV